MPRYTPKEAKLNYLTHLYAIFLAIIGSIVLLINVWLTNKTQFFGTLIYCITLINLFMASTIYHKSSTESMIKWTRKIDHMSISLLIVGTTTPIILACMPLNSALIYLGIMWGFAILTLILNLINIEKFKVYTMISYIVLGWVSLLNAKVIYQNSSLISMVLLILGGVAYSVGLIFFAKKKQYMHTIWHIFVNLGAILHFFCILFL